MAHAAFLDDVSMARRKLEQLPQNSAIRRALGDKELSAIEQEVQETTDGDMPYLRHPPLFGLVATKSLESLQALDNDLRLVCARCSSDNSKGVTPFLSTNAAKRLGDWYGGLFDMWTKAAAIRNGTFIESDVLLTNRRDHDMKLEINERTIHVECAAITPHDESSAVWDRFVEDKKTDPNKILIRPGSYCPPNAKGPSLYYSARRLYLKIYPKLTMNLDPDRGQFTDDEPNVLFLSFAGFGVDSGDPGVGWALDELFANQPRSDSSGLPDSPCGASLGAWVESCANDLIQKKKITSDWYVENWNRIMAAPRRLGGIILFDGTNLSSARLNYNSYSQCSVSHAEMAALEQKFNEPATYWI